MDIQPFARHSCVNCHEMLLLEWAGDKLVESAHECWAEIGGCGSPKSIVARGSAVCPSCRTSVTLYESVSDHQAVRTECCSARPPYPDGTPWSLRRAQAALRRYEASHNERR